MSTRMEVDHAGNVVQKETELPSNTRFNELIDELFSQNNWTYTENALKGVGYRNITLSNPNGKTYDVNVYSGNVRNELRSDYEKKIQLGKRDPRNKIDELTIIIGIYVFNKDDELKDALVVAYPIKMDTNYPSNPSLRGVFVDKTLQKAKINGLFKDEKKNIVAFRPEFIFYYLENYKKLHKEQTSNPITMSSPLSISRSHNRILFGAPGTGKSFTLNQDRKLYFAENNYDRVTFHPNYSYAHFIGTYKPSPKENDDTMITYKFVPGPFMKVWVKAYRSMQNQDGQNYLLIVEEINRANVVAVFGDVFQLLDRNNGESEYSIYVSEDIKRYLHQEFSKDIPENDWYKQLTTEEKDLHITTMKLYSNMYLWSTMNSADQGVFPIDTAFKRRWNFEYIGIDANQSKNDHYVTLAGGKVISWNDLRRAINSKIGKLNINEDKMIGPFFLNKTNIENNFNEVFKNKLLMYLYEDVIKYRRNEFFNGGINTYSELLESYDDLGGGIFKFELNYKSDDSEVYEGESMYETDGQKVAETQSEYRETAQKTKSDSEQGE